LYGITKLKTDIIFLSDIRLCSRNLVSCKDDVQHIFRNNPYGSYDCWFNSTSNKRGVGILIKRSFNVTALRTKADPEENYLLLEVAMSGNNLILGSVYGPNTQNIQFFNRLREDIESFNCNNVVLGGDWNCTYNTGNIESNIDCLNMTRPPNRAHSLAVNELCEALSLTDPYRVLHPNKKEFSKGSGCG
jgi:exonuclease III